MMYANEPAPADYTVRHELDEKCAYGRCKHCNLRQSEWEPAHPFCPALTTHSYNYRQPKPGSFLEGFDKHYNFHCGACGMHTDQWARFPVCAVRSANGYVPAQPKARA